MVGNLFIYQPEEAIEYTSPAIFSASFSVYACYHCIHCYSYSKISVCWIYATVLLSTPFLSTKKMNTTFLGLW